MLVWRWRKDGRDSGGFKMRAAAAVQVERPSGRCGCQQLGEKPESANIPRHMLHRSDHAEQAQEQRRLRAEADQEGDRAQHRNAEGVDQRMREPAPEK